MKNVPYIGVTGFMSRAEVDEVLLAVSNTSRRKLMVGVLVSSKTMQGIPNKWPGRYPRGENIAEIFSPHPMALNLVHFNTKDPDELLAHMVAVTELGGENFHGFQLNIKWPSPKTLYEYKKLYPQKIIVLQCGEEALKEIEYDPNKLAATASNYEHICEYLLVDPSGGIGKPFDTYKACCYLAVLNANTGFMGFGIAGGLSYESINELLSPIARIYPNTSIDAEGRLRDQNDNLDIAKAQAFVSRAYELFGD